MARFLPIKKPGQSSLAGRNTVIPLMLERVDLGGGDQRAGRFRVMEPQCVFESLLLRSVLTARATVAALPATAPVFG